MMYLSKDLSTRTCIFRPKGSIQDTHCICVGDHQFAYVGVEDGSIYMFNGNTLVHAHEKAHTETVFAIFRTQNGFVSGGADGVIKWWDKMFMLPFPMAPCNM